MTAIWLLAAVLFSGQKGGIEITVESETEAVDPARSVILSIEVKSPPGIDATMGDLARQTVGFASVEDFAESPVTNKSGTVVSAVVWKLVPKPCEKEYRIRPFTVGNQRFGPIEFAQPLPRESVTGGMELVLEKDFWGVVSPYWRFAREHWLWLLVGAGLFAAGLYLMWRLVRWWLRLVRERRMSPIERALAELDRLLRRGLPERGRYKDYYVELTMVVRRYIQRKYGIRAPSLTTEEFFAEIAASGVLASDKARHLNEFMTSADLVNFAGVQATLDMAQAAAASARGYLEGDNREGEK